jgi:hypothetical protein
VDHVADSTDPFPDDHRVPKKPWSKSGGSKQIVGVGPRGAVQGGLYVGDAGGQRNPIEERAERFER